VRKSGHKRGVLQHASTRDLLQSLQQQVEALSAAGTQQPPSSWDTSDPYQGANEIPVLNNLGANACT